MNEKAIGLFVSPRQLNLTTVNYNRMNNNFLGLPFLE